MKDQFIVPGGFKLISGGQTGSDQAALDWAVTHGVPHGGWCPKGRKTEDGMLAPQYQLLETPTSAYLQRTEWNVRDSDATVIFTMSDNVDRGSKRTVEFAEKLGKPYLHFRPGVHPKFIARFLSRHGVRVLNVAGKRESSAPGISEFVRNSFSSALLVHAGSEGEGQ